MVCATSIDVFIALDSLRLQTITYFGVICYEKSIEGTQGNARLIKHGKNEASWDF